MDLQDDCKIKRTERRIELIFAVVTGSVGGFFVFLFIWYYFYAKNNFHHVDGAHAVLLSLFFLIAYWFLKMTYKMAFHKCEYLLSTVEMKVIGWFFILLPPIAAADFIIAGKIGESIRYVPPTLPGIWFGYYALKIAKDRKAASNKGVVLDAAKDAAPHTP